MTFLYQQVGSTRYKMSANETNKVTKFNLASPFISVDPRLGFKIWDLILNKVALIARIH